MNCPFCHYQNEEGVLFCEQCKSDLGVLEATSFPDMSQAMAEAQAQLVAPIPAEPIHEEMIVSNPVPPEAALVVGDVLAAAESEAPLAEPMNIAAATADHAPLPFAGEAVSLATPIPLDGSAPITASSQPPRLVVTRGQKLNEEFPLFEGENYIGRADEKPVDIDLEHQEHPERIWSSRQHAVLTLDGGYLTIEDLNSSNGTFVNRMRIMAGDRFPLKVGDVIQIGTVQLKVKS